MIYFESISKQYGSKVLLDKVSFAIHEESRSGLIGVNGSGKTTLLRMIAGVEAPDHGSIKKSAETTIGYLPQEVEILDDKTPLEIVLAPFEHILSYEEKLEALTNQFEEDKTRNDVLKKIADLQHEMEVHDVFSLHARAESILDGLGVPKKHWTLPIQSLSGGYRMRTCLGALLLLSPKFLLLDEPTNHLDMDSLVWLEKFLLRYKGGMLIVSHDRDFLNRMTTHTAEITPGAITVYKGNYSEFVEAKKLKEESDENRARNLQIKIAQTERFIERFRAKNTKATQAQSRMKLLETLKSELPETVAEQKSIHFTFEQPKPSGVVPVKLNKVSVKYGENTVFTNVTFDINRGEKVAIVGPNGAGKSTILKLMNNLISPYEGNIELGYNTELRYFGQHQLEQLNPNLSLYETISQVSIKTEKTFIRNILGAFLFSGDDVDKKVEVLSGGEKSRLVLASILASPGNTLLLDEPTNHLDIKSIEILAEALKKFEGTVIFVSHDEFFVSQIATRIIEMRPSLIRDFPGTLEDYRSYIEAMFKGDLGDESSSNKDQSSLEKTKDPVISEKEKRIQDKNARKKIGRAIEKLEKEIENREILVSQCDEILNNPENATNHELLHKTTIDLEDHKTALDELVAQWEKLQIEMEEFESA